MVNWLGIEDASAVPTRVWLSRERDTDDWKPLRKADCQALNQSSEKPVLIDGGRATADPEFGVIRYNYYSWKEIRLTSATWFLKTIDDKDNKKIGLVPLPVEDAEVIETLFQKAIYAASSLGDGMEGILKEAIPLPTTEENDPDKNYRIMVQKSSDGQHYVMRKCEVGTWFGGKYFDLQRGYGAYSVDGEEEELLLGPVQHLIFVVHGIGEAMFSREDFVYTTSLIEDVNNMRMTIQKRQIAEWKQACEKAKKEKKPEPSPPNRMELIPILWYDRVHSTSTPLMRSLQAATLKTIPALREIANDVIFDVLMYLTPNFCYEVLLCVTDQIIAVYELFKKNNPHFDSIGGKCSLVGHSLGSVICWDLLTILQENISKSKNNMDDTVGTKLCGLDLIFNTSNYDCKHRDHGVHISPDGYSGDTGYQQYASGEGANQAKNGSWGPSLPKPMPRCLPFVPDFSLFLGSPIGLFLTLRGAHPVFDELRDHVEGEVKPKASPFSLPSRSIRNVFHPSDPVAYRIEPLLLAQGTEQIPPPLYLTREGEGLRFHLKAYQFTEDIKRSFLEKKTSISSFVTTLAGSAQGMLTKLDERHLLERAQDSSSSLSKNEDGPLRFPLAGRAGRLDFQLQPRVIDNEYVSAVLAHSSYFTNTDVLDYMADLATVKKQEVANTNVTSLSGNEIVAVS